MLIGNGRLIDKIPMSFLGRDGLNNLQPSIAVGSTWAESFGPLAALPDGYYTPQGWMLPRTAGRMVSRNSALTINTAGVAVGGVTSDGTASITFSVPDATGQLISSGEGSAIITFTVADLLLTASVGGTGAASFAITPNTPVLGALASGQGEATLMFTVGNAQAYPLNDASPLRTGAASFAITGALVPYAIGSMSGSTAGGGVLSEASIIAAMNASPPAVNIKMVNGYTVTGTGQPGAEWGP